MTFNPDGAGYDFTAPTRFDKLLAGEVFSALPAYLPQSEEGREQARREDTLDADYGQLLERVYCKGWRPQRDSNPRRRRERAVS